MIPPTYIWICMYDHVYYLLNIWNFWTICKYNDGTFSSEAQNVWTVFDGKSQHAKTFRTKCINLFHDKKMRISFSRQESVSKLFSRQKSVSKLFSWQKRVCKIAIRCPSQNSTCCFCNNITILWWHNRTSLM